MLYILYSMSYIRKIKKGNKIYLAEVESRWINGKSVQKHIKYIGKEVDGKKILSASISNLSIDTVKVYGPLLVLNNLAQKLGLSGLLGEYGNEILSLAYAHCLDYKSLNQMDRWFERTDLNLMLNMEGLTEKRLLNALDSLEEHSLQALQQRIFEAVKKNYKLRDSGVLYDVTNTYLYGKRCSLGKLGKDKEGVKGRPLVQIGLGVTLKEAIPMFHKVFNGNVHDARTFQDFIETFGQYSQRRGMVIYDRGVSSAKNIRDVQSLKWDTLCGLPIKADLKKKIRELINQNEMIQFKHRVKLKKTVFYVVCFPYQIDAVTGTLAVCFNEQRRRDIRESRYDEIVNAQQLLKQSKQIKWGLAKYFYKNGSINTAQLDKAEEFDGYSCIFSTKALPKEEMVRLYFDKDLIEKAFRSIKGIVRLQPIRHWLYNRVIAHVFICYLSYLLLSLLQYRLKKTSLSAEKALSELDSMYKVYMRDEKKGFKISRVVTLTKMQEDILKAVDKKLLKLA